MNEAYRQSYLQALGLTPWVARAPLPGAAPSPWLEWEDETENSASPAATPASSDPVDPAPAHQSPAPSVSLKDSLQQAPKPKAVAATADAPAPQKPVPVQGKGLTFTLEAHQGTDTWLLCAQEDSQAPGLGRFEAPLMASLLALFQGRPGRPRRFYCPLTDQPMQADEAAQALAAFIAGLSAQAGGSRVLMLLPESLNQALFSQPRYQAFDLGGRKALVVSSLSEMLEDPATHKKASWQAMQEHGFDGT